MDSLYHGQTPCDERLSVLSSPAQRVRASGFHEGNKRLNSAFAERFRSRRRNSFAIFKRNAKGYRQILRRAYRVQILSVFHDGNSRGSLVVYNDDRARENRKAFRA